MTQEWNIRPRSAMCGRCQTAFSDGQICYSGIETVASDWVRRDWCADCWQGYRREHPAHGAWQGRYRAPQSSRPDEPLRRETAEALLRRLIDEDAAVNAAVIFVLAVMLERKKILIERDARDQPDGSRIRLYEHRHSGELIRIADPRLSLDDLEPLQESVMQHLTGSGTQQASI